MYVLDRLVPPPPSPDLRPGTWLQSGADLGCTLILGMFLYNFPEGMAIVIGTVTDMSVSLVIAIQGIPEGVCTRDQYDFPSRGRKRSI